ncbi:hypothetical protein FZ103_08925 [Streptomonospora sp. PA3]|uniref:DUF6343 family protein n=1 Tax=Streptomonospora sp. PA3 TaxID=2607326 RepID=UPI0012DFCE52|nr:DUF6343 family protein [Streptomonospora sp. PA3]MUL41299.1 hypothetical protein [Streptomonospora sp. PA3]
MTRGQGDKPPRGSHDRPRSALNLRLALAVLGILICVPLGVTAWVTGFTAVAVILWVLALIGVLDIAVVLWRRRQRGPGHRSLFE